MKRIKLVAGILVMGSIYFSSCRKDNLEFNQIPPSDLNTMMDEKGQNPDEVAIAEGVDKKNKGEHFVYSESNDPQKNYILIYEEQADGTLKPDGMVSSGGNGNGAGLGSQGAVILDENHKWLFAVNAGSNSISSFKVQNDGSLVLKHTVSSFGNLPVSLTVNNSRLYVVNAGSDNIHGFKVNGNGTMTSIPGSDRPLSASPAGPAQISFGPDGKWLVVTEKATNKILRFDINGAGSLDPGIATPSVGQTPFGFNFSQNKFMIVSNAAGGAAGAGSCTSYKFSNGGTFNDINGAIGNNEAAPCWVAMTAHGRYAFVTNTASNSISSYFVDKNGQLFLINGIAATSGAKPLDIVVSSDNKSVYVLCGGDHTMYQYKRGRLGRLVDNGFLSGLPSYAAGLAAY